MSHLRDVVIRKRSPGVPGGTIQHLLDARQLLGTGDVTFMIPTLKELLS